MDPKSRDSLWTMLVVVVIVVAILVIIASLKNAGAFS